ncbi:putative acyltransferase [Filimonas zeae]|uniref:acyltransferase family protein n=1 Tax=Filimonas zeae TaxID=1737353 RepID=UPI001662DA84|nr:DUF5009 domain-containing protein [Filimonas zeae]MDR6341812.1 putative acyltransferase [Filimonas zeae]
MSNRYYSLDVFRGATVALMVLVNNPGSWTNIYPPLEHASWHGCTPTDLVFPFFLFAVGNSIAFVMQRYEKSESKVFLKKVIKRAALIFIIGLLLNWSPFIRWEDNSLIAKKWETVRIMGVLQRIAICYLFASLSAFYLNIRQIFILCIVTLASYWLLCIWASPNDPFSIQGYFGTHWDKMILGVNHMYKGEGQPFDPEGLVSTLPAIVQILFGYLAGYYIRQKGKHPRFLPYLLLTAFVFISAGLLWHSIFPINKKIWSSSYVLYSTGFALLFLSLLIFLFEKKGKGAYFFSVFGKNALFVFILSGLLPRLLGLIRIPNNSIASSGSTYSTPFSWFYTKVCTAIFENLRSASLLYAVIMVVFYWLIAYVLDKKKIYIKV